MMIHTRLAIVLATSVAFLGGTAYEIYALSEVVYPRNGAEVRRWLTVLETFALLSFGQVGLYLSILSPVAAYTLSGKWCWSVRLLTFISTFAALNMAKLIVDGIQIVSLLMNKNEDFQIVSLLMNKNEDFQNVWLLMHINEDIQNVWLMHKNAGMQTVLATNPRMILESVLFLLMYLVFVVCTLVWIGLRGRRFGNPAEAKAPTNE